MPLTPPLDSLRLKLGLPGAPLVEENLVVVAEFFQNVLGISPDAWFSYLRGIDFHHPVRKRELAPTTELVRHKPTNASVKPFLYFADVGSSPMRTGTNFPQVVFERYQVTTPLWALQSIASSISFSPEDRVSRPGGARQYIISAGDFIKLRRI